MVRGFGIGPKFKHSARDVDGAGDLAARLHFRRVAYVDHQRITSCDHLLCLRLRNARYDGVGGFY